MSPSLVRAPYPRLILALRAIAEALVCPEDGAVPEERLDWMCDEFLAHLPLAGARARFGVRLVTFAVSVLAPLFVFRLVPFRALPLRLRVTALSRMEESALAAPVLAAKVMVCMLWYEQPDVQREVGFVGQGVRARLEERKAS